MMSDSTLDGMYLTSILWNYNSLYFYHCKYLCFVYYEVTSKETGYNLDANKETDSGVDTNKTKHSSEFTWICKVFIVCSYC